MTRHGRAEMTRWVGNVLPGLPAHVAYEWEQRAVFRREERRRAAIERRRRRTEAAAWVWSAGAAATGIVTVGPEHFESIWVVATVLITTRAAFAWRWMLRSAHAHAPAEPVPPLTVRPLRLPWGSAVAEPLHRAESSAAIVGQIVLELPPGPLKESGDQAVRAAAESVAVLRARASQAAACEAAARKVRDPAYAAQAHQSVSEQVAQLREGAVELEGLLVALSHLVATAGRDDYAVPLARLRLQEATATVQGLARGMRDLEEIPPGTTTPF